MRHPTWGDTCLHIAAEFDLDLVFKLLVRRIEARRLYELISLADDDGETVLHKAARNNNPDILEALLKQLEQLEFERMKLLFMLKDDSGLTPIHNAARNRNPEHMQILWRFLHSDMKTLLQDNYGLSLPYAAILDKDTNHMPCVRNHLQHTDGEPEALCSSNLLHYVCKYTDADYASKVLDGVRLEDVLTLLCGVDCNGLTPLTYVLMSCNSGVVQTILRLFNRRNRMRILQQAQYQGKTLFHEAVRTTNKAFLSVLLEDLGRKRIQKLLSSIEESSETILHLAAQNPNECMIQVITEHLTSDQNNNFIQWIDRQGNTPLHIAAGNKNSHVLTTLLNKLDPTDAMFHTLIELGNNDEQNVLQLAAACSSPEAVNLLIQHFLTDRRKIKQLSKMVDNSKNNLLHLTASNSTPGVFKVMYSYLDELTALSMITGVNNDGNTVLHLAMNNSSSNIMKAILDTGLQLQEQLFVLNAVGQSMLQLAAEHCRTANVKLLLTSFGLDTVTRLVLCTNDKGENLIHTITKGNRLSVAQRGLLQILDTCLDEKTLSLMLSAVDNTGVSALDRFLYTSRQLPASSIKNIFRISALLPSLVISANTNWDYTHYNLLLTLDISYPG